MRNTRDNCRRRRPFGRRRRKITRGPGGVLFIFHKRYIAHAGPSIGSRTMCVASCARAIYTHTHARLVRVFFSLPRRTCRSCWRDFARIKRRSPRSRVNNNGHKIPGHCTERISVKRLPKVTSTVQTAYACCGTCSIELGTKTTVVVHWVLRTNKIGETSTLDDQAKATGVLNYSLKFLRFARHIPSIAPAVVSCRRWRHSERH